MDNDKTINLLSHANNFKFKLILQSTIIGLIVGIIIVVYRVLVNKFSALFTYFYNTSKHSVTGLICIFLALIVCAIVVSYMVKKESMISGSGIPQVEGILTRKIKNNWFKVLFNKFFGGIICLAAGLSVGREGPSVQMGACVGEGFAKIFRRINIEEKYLITSGASAGLSAAFNAPISGVMFALEEVHKNFSPIILLSAMASALGADFISKQFFGIAPTLHFAKVPIMPLKYYGLLILLGITVGISGVIFSKGILKTQSIFNKSKLKTTTKIMIPFIIAGLVGITCPILLGGGHELIMHLGEGSNYTLKILIIFLFVKFLFTFTSFGAGVPGGIFFPLLVLGAIVGNIFAMISHGAFSISSMYTINFIILAMAGHFASIVKAPITGIVLISEMTGSYEHLLPLAIVVIIAHITSDILKLEPIYESLLDRLIKKGNNKYEATPSKKTLLELVVHIGSKVENKQIYEVSWPNDCLVVAVRRGEKEFIPNGNTLILAGDYITIMIDEDKYVQTTNFLDNLCSKIQY